MLASLQTWFSGPQSRILWGRFARSEGQTLVEYALIISLVALAVTGAAIFLGGQITSFFSAIGNDL